MPNGSNPLVAWAAGLESLLAAQPSGSQGLTPGQIGQLRTRLVRATSNLTNFTQALDPIRLPGKVFNPSDPALVGPFIGLGLLAQPRLPLAEIGMFYGSGVYAIYYRGDFDAYAPLKETEHPLYVGKADPDNSKAEGPVGQGPQLALRLAEHARNIVRAGNLRIEDFECRFLVIASGWQESAETFLIRLYKPVWNKETRICHGLGKHGDAGETRTNKRSPWDTMHPGRTWAANEILADQFAEEVIREKLAAHFLAHPPIGTIDAAIDQFFAALR